MAESLFALASAPGRSAIAVWRLSGPDVARALTALTARAPPEPRRAALRMLIDPADGAPLDQALVLFMPGPNSFTGEDCAELQTHGGRAVAEAIGAALGRLPGFRPADPGEFSRRAFMNGKLDLTRAEGIADLAAAETDAQRRQALAQAGGALASLYDNWRDRLIRLRAHLEAAIEFPDEDIGDPMAGLAENVTTLRAEIAAHLVDARRGERLRDGATVAIVGAPNSGKSSLFNLLARRDAAIVSAEAGTTRDVLEVHLNLGDYAVILADTAGLRSPSGAVEAEGIARARACAATADLVLALFAADQPADANTLALLDDRAIVVTSKADLAPSSKARDLDDFAEPAMRAAIAVSTTAGIGIDALLGALTARVGDLVGERGAPPPTRARHREALSRCVAALDDARGGQFAELSAEDFRRAADALGRIVGRVDIEDTLDSIFLEFCIGK